MAVQVFTSITCHDIPKARVLAESVKRIHPDFRFHLVLVDAAPSWFRIEDEPFDELIGLADLGISKIDQWLFKHDAREACAGVKGRALVRLLSAKNCEAVLYFDPDIVVLSRLDSLIAQFQKAAVLLTPHLPRPEQTAAAIADKELSLLRHGAYNLGFLGVRGTEEGLAFAKWWADRLEQFCYDDIPGGLFLDQRWAELATAFFPGVRVLREPEYNVGAWNPARRVTGRLSSGFMAEDRPVAFYRSSGFDSGADMPALCELQSWYSAECDRKGQRELGDAPWAYGVFDNGQTITKAQRILYRERADLQTTFPHPFATADLSRSYYHWFQRNGNPRPSLSVPAGSPPPLTVPAALLTPYPSPSAADPEYRVIVSVCEIAGDAMRAVAEICRATFRKDRITLIGPAKVLRPLQDAAICPMQVIETPEHSQHEDAFRAAAARFGYDMDFVFVAAGVAVPDLWDVRLAWTAQLAPGIATVSPINNTFEFAALDLPGSVPEIDAACYANSLLANPAVSSFYPDCFWMNHEALADAGGKSRREFRDRASELRWAHVIADHIFTRAAGPAEEPPIDPPAPIRALEEHLSNSAGVFSGSMPQPLRRQLHVMHSWGGGLERWVEDYGRADEAHDNFVLKSFGVWGAFGQELRLFRNVNEATPLKRWPLTPPIKGTASTHTAYRAAFDEIVNDYGIDAVLVSSLVGHSLDVFRTGLKTVMICHEFYPFCPALNITFDSVCSRCEEEHLVECTRHNPHNRFFRNIPPREWLRVRRDFVSAIQTNGIRMIAPAESVRGLYSQLVPELAPHFQVIPHGTRPLEHPLKLEFNPARRLSLVVLGSLAPHKGEALLGSVLPDLVEFADVHLIGCGEYGPQFARPGVSMINEYKLPELRGILESIKPEAGLLLSVVPESFSYTLQELFELAIPPVATRIGSFADRIQDNETGFLVDPNPGSVLQRLRSLSEDRAQLERVHRRLLAAPHRTIEEMLADYEAAIGAPGLSARAYFAPERRSTTPGHVMLRLTWRPNGSPYPEDTVNSVRVPVSDAPRVVSIRAPGGEGAADLRLMLDPSTSAVVLFRIQLIDRDRKPLWSWTSFDDRLDSDAPSGDLIWLGGDAGALVFLSGPQPSIRLPIRNDLVERLESGCRLELELAFPQPAEAMARMAAALSQNDRLSLNDRDRESLRSYIADRCRNDRVRPVVGSASLLAELDAARARIADLEQSLSWRITEPLRKGGSLVLNALRRAR